MPRPIAVALLAAALILTTHPGPESAAGGRDVDPAIFWRFQTSAGTLTSPVADDSSVYVGSDDGFVYAVDAATGLARWGTDVGDPVQVAPAIDGEALYLSTGDFVAVDAESGVIRLRIHGDRNRLHSPVTLANGRAYVGGARNTNGFVDALNPTTGVLHWRQRIEGEVVAAPVVAAGVVYVGSIGGRFVALDADSGAVIWEFEAAGPITNAAAVIDDVVYARSWDDPSRVASGGPATSQGFLYALDTATGTEHWRARTDAAAGSAPVVADGTLFVGAGRAIFAFDAGTGDQRWRFHAGGEMTTTPALANGILYVGARDANLYALDASTGAELWRIATRDPIASSPIVADGIIYVTGGGVLYAIIAN